MASSMYGCGSLLLRRNFKVLRQCQAGKRVLNIEGDAFEVKPKPHPEEKLAKQYPSERPQGKVAGKLPVKLKLEAGKRYSWCACGYSHNQPFCDGTHKQKREEKRQPGFNPVRFRVEETKEYWLCLCKQTNNEPWCDGSHKKEAVAKIKQIQVTT